MRDALNAFNAFNARSSSLHESSKGQQSLYDEADLDAELHLNPNLIIPFSAMEDDNENDFALQMKKCRKPRATKPRTSAV